jgi:hypothetical protein
MNSHRENEHTRRQVMAGALAVPALAATYPEVPYAKTQQGKNQLQWALEDNWRLRWSIGILVRGLANEDEAEIFDGLKAVRMLDAPDPEWELLSTPETRAAFMDHVAQSRKKAA